MEFKISELLDDYRDGSIDFEICPDASVTRIKELTMKKIHEKQKPRGWGLKTISRIILIAAVLASLAVPVMAATGFHFTQWVEGLFHHDISDYDHDITSGKHWRTSGWVLSLNAENVTSQGMGLRCTDTALSVAEKPGSLTAMEDYWIEKWNGEEYVKLSDTIYKESTHEIISQDTVSWEISWADTYGQLPSGHYRLGKTFLYTGSDGRTEQITVYAKFRVLLQEMEGYVKICQEAVDKLKNQESYHLTRTYYPPDGGNIPEGRYHHYAIEIWKHGYSFLEQVRYIAEDGTVIHRKGGMYLDGQGYDLDWKGESVLSGVSGWGDAYWIMMDNVDFWAGSVSPDQWAGSMGEVYVDSGIIGLIWGSHGARDNEWYNSYTEMRYFFDEAGDLTDIRIYYTEDLQCAEEDLRLDETVEIHDTPVEEIAKVIEAQNVSEPAVFSWAEERQVEPMVEETDSYTDFVKVDGFVNTIPGLIATPMDAVEAAMRECTLGFKMASRVWYDPDADMWKVKIYWSQREDYQYIYLDGRGNTKLMISHETVNIGG